MLKSKTGNLLFLIIASGLLFSFSERNNGYQFECISLESDGYVILKIWNTKSGSRYKPEEARKDAIKAILYSGIAGNNHCQSQSPLLKNSTEVEQFKPIEKGFFSNNGKWSSMTRNASMATTLPEIIEAKNWKVYQISVAKNELRKYLEEQQIIKSLNNLF